MVNYKSIRTVAGMIARSHKHLEFDIYDMIEWCGEAIKNIGNFESFRHYEPGVDKCCRLRVENKQVLLPCNVYRLLSVYHKHSSINNTDYLRDGDYIRFRKNHYDDGEEIQIEYLGIIIDEEGFPMVDELQLQACYYYCLKMMMMEDFLLGKTAPGAFQFLDQQYGKYVQKARSSFKNTTRNDMDEIMMIMYNMVPKIRLPKNLT